ncbi:MAG TPA: hypothetical protein DCR40_14040 [Prolixibacteraceae bacterium]|nr:hypothetical protein [Prolixibacteraceae bacterium]
MNSRNNVMEFNEKQQLVLQWIESGCDYEQGTLLYGKFGKNKSLKTYFLGKTKTYVTKLTYELCKSVALNYAQLQKDNLIPDLKAAKQENASKHEVKYLFQNSTDGKVAEDLMDAILKEVEEIARIPEVNQNTVVDQAAPNAAVPEPVEGMPELLSATNIAEYPPIIRRIISEYAETFQERSKTHRILTEMPQGNSQALKTKRAEIFDLVKSFTVRLEYLFKIRQQFEQNGELPIEDEVWPKPKELPETTLSEDPEELRKMKKNQQTANTKDQNMLDYQTMVKGDEKKTMPSGPKRTRIQNRIKGRLKFIQEIDLKLVSLNAN